MKKNVVVVTFETPNLASKALDYLKENRKGTGYKVIEADLVNNDADAIDLAEGFTDEAVFADEADDLLGDLVDAADDVCGCGGGVAVEVDETFTIPFDTVFGAGAVSLVALVDEGDDSAFDSCFTEGVVSIERWSASEVRAAVRQADKYLRRERRAARREARAAEREARREAREELREEKRVERAERRAERAAEERAELGQD